MIESARILARWAELRGLSVEYFSRYVDRSAFNNARDGRQLSIAVQNGANEGRIVDVLVVVPWSDRPVVAARCKTFAGFAEAWTIGAEIAVALQGSRKPGGGGRWPQLAE